MFQKTLFSAGFKGFLHLLSKPLFSFVGLSFCCFCISVFFFLPLLLLFHKSSCYVLVSVFCSFGFPGFACVLLRVSFGLFLVSLFFFFGRV